MSVVERIRTEERHRSYTDLIDAVAVGAQSNAVAFRRIRIRIDEIRRWFAEKAGWSTVVTGDMVRLVKAPSAATAAQGFSWAGVPLDYELMAWMLWYEEVLDGDQFVCSKLVRELEAQISATVEPGHFSWDRHDHRLALERVMNALVSMDAVRRVDGSIGDYLRGASADALYEFTGVARHLHVTIPRELAHATRVRDFGYLSVANERVPAHQRLYRSLILAPVLYAHQDREAFDLLAGRDARASIAADLREHLGWDLEVTMSYACLLRPAAKGQAGTGFPRTNSAVLHVVLLLCERLREIAQTKSIPPDTRDRILMSQGQFLVEVMALRDAYGMNWGKRLSPEEMAIDELAKLVLASCREWGMVEDGEEGTLRFLPITARYFGVYSDSAIASFDEPDDEA